MELIGAPTHAIAKEGAEVRLLDFGYVRFIEHWGADYRIIEAARMSTDKGFVGWESDARLLKYLYENRHATPFEFAGMVLEIAAPIFVFREWHRHRTQSYNEMSGRYVPLPNENYVPEMNVLIGRSHEAAQTKNKQAQGTKQITDQDAESWADLLRQSYSLGQLCYETGLEVGVPKELARLSVAVGRYSRMRAGANLRNWLAFLTLRSAENAQWEIRMYAHAVGLYIKECFPRTWALFLENGRGV